MAGADQTNGLTVSFMVQLLNQTLVKAGDQRRAPYTLQLSNFDYLQSYPICFAYFYPNPKVGSFASVSVALKASLAATLEYFPPLAGRIVPQRQTGLPEVFCNNEGAEVIEAYVDVPLAALDLCHLNLCFERIHRPPAAEVSLGVQLNGYACGGFSIFWTFNHMLADATAFSVFLSAWSETTRGNKITREPCHDRQMFPARSPPHYGPLVDRTFVKATPDDLSGSRDEHSFPLRRLYRVEASDVHRLRELASSGDGRHLRRKTRLEAFSAYVWKLLARAASPAGPDARCTMRWAVDGRRAMGGGGAAALSGYFGNVVSVAMGEMSAGDLLRLPLSEVSRTVAAVGDRSHFLEVADWVEQHKAGGLCPGVIIGHSRPSRGLILSFCERIVPVGELDMGFGPPSLGFPYMRVEDTGGMMVVFPSALGNGSWVVVANVLPELAEVMESDDDGGGSSVFKRMTDVTCPAGEYGSRGNGGHAAKMAAGAGNLAEPPRARSLL